MATKTSKFPGLTVNPSNHRCINTALFFFSLLFFVFFHCFVFFSLLCFFVFFSLLCFFFVFFFHCFVFLFPSPCSFSLSTLFPLFYPATMASAVQRLLTVLVFVVVIGDAICCLLHPDFVALGGTYDIVAGEQNQLRLSLK